jgi:HPt (histidine-containing phosphotransfer) domain-containing protein
VYLRELPGRLEKLEAALNANDAETFAQYCHGLKGTSKSIGAVELADLCGQHELAGYDGNLPSSDEFSDFRDLAERTGIALRRTLKDQSAGS